MKIAQRWAGFSAITIALTYIVGFTAFLAILGSPESDSPADQVKYLQDNEAVLTAVTAVIYLIPGIALVFLSLGVHRRLSVHAPELMNAATVFGFIWATIVIASGMIYNLGLANVVELVADYPDEASSAWVAIETVQDGLGGGSELVGAIWVLLLTLVAHRSKALPTAVNVLGYVIAAAGILTIVPALSLFQAVFGLVQIPWFIWLGTVLLRPADPQ